MVAPSQGLGPGQPLLEGIEVIPISHSTFQIQGTEMHTVFPTD